MSLDAKDYAWLAKDAYNNQKPDYAQQLPIPLNGHKYRVINYANDPSGFHATAYQQVDDPHSVIIAYRGTDPDIKHHTLTAVQDVMVDTLMVADKINPQEADARRFTQEVLDYAEQHHLPADQITVTGHSLGGTLAEIESSRFGLHGTTFNAYGAVDLGFGVPQGGGLLTNYVDAADVVSAASRHYGHVVPLASTQDIDALKAAGFMDGHGSAIEIAVRYGAKAHSIDNFAPDAGGASILSLEDATRAQVNAKAIEAYRSNVHELRRDLHVTTELPFSPTFNLARTTEMADAAATGAEAIAREAKAAGHGVEHVASRAGEAVEQGVAHAGHELAQGIHNAEAALRDFSHPHHPQHALYASLKERLPTGTSEPRLAQVTAACRKSGMNKPEDVGDIHINATHALLLGNSLGSTFAEIDLTQPVPSVQQSVQKTAQYDRQQERMQAQVAPPFRALTH